MINLREVTFLTSPLDIKKYRQLSPATFESIRRTAKKVRGAPVLHINATPRGGGVAELLNGQVRFERAYEIESRWFTIQAPKRFFRVTKKFHNLLQGKPGALSEKEKSLYLAVTRELGESLQKIVRRFHPGIVVVHDPQPLPLVRALPPKFSSILRLHIDLSTPNPNALEFLRPFIASYNIVVVSSDAYRPSLPWLKKSNVKTVYPAIDPYSEKNAPLGLNPAKRILEQLGVNCSKPIIAQVSRFDPWKDPEGVIKAYYLAKNRIPNLQLVLAGFILAQDDPEAISVLRKIKKHASGDPDLHLFEDPRKLKTVSNDTFVNALYIASDVIVQKSLREGFGLTITEAMWKGKAVVAGTASGALLQIRNGKTGILVSSPEAAARAVVGLIKNPDRRERLGRAAHRSVKRKFLLPRYILDNLSIYRTLLDRRGSTVRGS